MLRRELIWLSILWVGLWMLPVGFAAELAGSEAEMKSVPRKRQTPAAGPVSICSGRPKRTLTTKRCLGSSSCRSVKSAWPRVSCSQASNSG